MRDATLVLRRDGALLRTIPLSLLERVICRSSVDMRSSVIPRLLDSGVGVILFSGRRNIRCAAFAPAGTLDVTRRIDQYRHILDPVSRHATRVRLVRHKLLGQRRHLLHLVRQRPDKRRTLLGSIRAVGTLEQRLRHGDASNADTLLGIEGAAAARYYRGFASVLPAELGFHARNRRPPRDPVNAVLSLGYTLLTAEAQIAIESVGLDPWLGLHHEPAHGRPSLACDLAEPFRWQVDRMAWQLVRDRSLARDHFEYRGEACLLAKSGRARFWPAWEIRARMLRRVLATTVLRWAQRTGHE